VREDLSDGGFVAAKPKPPGDSTVSFHGQESTTFPPNLTSSCCQSHDVFHRVLLLTLTTCMLMLLSLLVSPPTRRMCGLSDPDFSVKPTPSIV